MNVRAGIPPEISLKASARQAARPGYAEALNNRGLVLLELNRPADALASYERPLDARPGDREALYTRGWTALLMGDFETGWAGYEHRWNR